MLLRVLLLALCSLSAGGVNGVVVAGRRGLNTVSTSDVASGYGGTSEGGC